MVSRSDDDPEMMGFLHIYLSLRARTIGIINMMVCVCLFSCIAVYLGTDRLSFSRDQSSEIDRESTKHTGLKQ